jgi:predicted amidohydrolase
LPRRRARRIRIALAQMPYSQGRLEKNLATAERYLVRAARRGADLVAFPECFADFARAYAEAVPSGPVCRRFAKLAGDLGVHLVMGSIGEKCGRRVYNTACIFDDRGELVGSYRKRFLWWTERATVSPGRDAPVFDTRLGRVGLAICWDLAFPEHFRELALAGAQLIVCPAFWQAGDRFGRLGPRRGRRAARLTGAERFFIDSCVPARAAENSVVMAFVNASGRTRPDGRPDRLAGRSQVAVPLNGVVARARERPRLLLADVDLSWSRDGERIYGTREDAGRAGRC